jgi:hypothetical protein
LSDRTAEPAFGSLAEKARYAEVTRVLVPSTREERNVLVYLARILNTNEVRTLLGIVQRVVRRAVSTRGS